MVLSASLLDSTLQPFPFDPLDLIIPSFKFNINGWRETCPVLLEKNNLLL